MDPQRHKLSSIQYPTLPLSFELHQSERIESEISSRLMVRDEVNDDDDDDDDNNEMQPLVNDDDSSSGNSDEDSESNPLVASSPKKLSGRTTLNSHPILTMWMFVLLLMVLLRFIQFQSKEYEMEEEEEDFLSLNDGLELLEGEEVEEDFLSSNEEPDGLKSDEDEDDEYLAAEDDEEPCTTDCDKKGHYKGTIHDLDDDEVFWNSVQNNDNDEDNIDAEPLLEEEIIPLPKRLDHLSDLSVPFHPKSDLPFFWHIPKSGGVTMKDIVSRCYSLVEASEVGRLYGQDKDDFLEVLERDGTYYVNVDTTTPEGIQRAENLHLGSSGLADVVFTAYFHDVSDIFTPEHPGRCFTLFRHPIKRAISMYHHLHNADWDNPVKELSMEEYVVSAHSEENWVTRFLLNQMDGDLHMKDLERAKEILRRKCLVGLLDAFEESIRRFELYFGWNTNSTKETKQCRDKYVEFGDNVQFYSAENYEGVVWNNLMRRNQFDMRLYEYVQNLFQQQSVLF